MINVIKLKKWFSSLTLINKASLSFRRTSVGILILFLGAVCNYLRTLCAYIHQIISFVPNDCEIFIVYVFPGEVKVYTLFGKKQVSEINIKFVIISVAEKQFFSRVSQSCTPNLCQKHIKKLLLGHT